MTIVVNNSTHYANIRYENTDNKGREFSILIVKAAFDLASNNLFLPSEDQEPLVFTDEFYDELNESALRYPSDLVPFKPKTDVIFDLIARSPDSFPRESWLCSVRLWDQAGISVEKTVRVTGPRWWKPIWKRALSEREARNWRKHRDLFLRWEITSPEPIFELPVRYEYAFGGALKTAGQANGAPSLVAYERNPVGRGWIDREHTDHTVAQPAPQIEDPDDPIVDPYKSYDPQGFGPIPAAWLPRRPLGGTFDKAWVDQIWPNWPPDYDFEYHNSSAIALRGPDGQYMDGVITCEISNMPDCGRGNRQRFQIVNPTVFISVARQYEKPDLRRLNLDTIFFDMSDHNPMNHRVFISGRTVMPSRVDLAVNIKRKPDWMVLDGGLLKRTFLNSPHPNEIV